MKFGNIEPEGHAHPDWQELGTWLAAFNAATGFPIAFMYMDVTWGLPWQSDLAYVASVVRSAGIPFGVIYNGDSHELSDQDWATNTARHYMLVEVLLGQQVDQVIFQSWHAYPLHALPETDPSTLTGIVRSYLRPSSNLQVTGTGKARLTNETGAPIPGAVIHVETDAAEPEARLESQSISGTVPQEVTTARFALRVKAECQCPAKPTDVSLGGFLFAQPDHTHRFAGICAPGRPTGRA